MPFIQMRVDRSACGWRARTVGRWPRRSIGDAVNELPSGCAVNCHAGTDRMKGRQPPSGKRGNYLNAATTAGSRHRRHIRRRRRGICRIPRVEQQILEINPEQLTSCRINGRL